MKKRAYVRVPASSGNLGPGFDVLGLALEFWNELFVEVIDSKPGRPVILIEGEGARTLPQDERHLIYKAMQGIFRKAGKKLPRVKFLCLNRIPLARGLGSSSAAHLSGLLAGNVLLGNRFTREEILTMATELEGHPDNVAPALFGGVRASGVMSGRVVSALLPAPTCHFIAAIPAFELSTKKARAVLPVRVPLKDAVFNLSAVALLPKALESSPVLLGDLLNDKLHEPYRAKLIPGFTSVKKAALKAGAYGMTLSGAGPTLLAYAPRQKSAAVGKAMQAAFRKAGVACVIKDLKLDMKGAVVE